VSAKTALSECPGKDKAFNALVGQYMRATKGQANPAQVIEILRRKLAG
jgi:aspartyl-tRNA(Asn)/glutamyl-tRNA(Gln) amidotransferase subunit B